MFEVSNLLSVYRVYTCYNFQLVITVHEFRNFVVFSSV